MFFYIRMKFKLPKQKHGFLRLTKEAGESSVLGIVYLLLLNNWDYGNIY